MSSILSLIGFIVALVWTWNVVYSKQNSESIEIHYGLQQKLGDLIKQQLMAKKPQTTDIIIQKLWTEKINDTKVRAVFSYKYKENLSEGESTDQVIQGEAFLFREPTEDPKTQKWIVQSVRSQSNQISFSEGSVITPGSTEETPAPTATEGTAKPAEPAKPEAPKTTK